MRFNPLALLIFAGFGVFLAMAVSSNRSSLFHFAEAAATVAILISIGGFLRGGRSKTR